MGSLEFRVGFSNGMDREMQQMETIESKDGIGHYCIVQGLGFTVRAG